MPESPSRNWPMPGNAADWLKNITNYQAQLHKSQYGYFHYLTGLTQAQDHPTKVEPLMKKALEYGLNMKHDRAMATLNLAAAAISKGRKLFVVNKNSTTFFLFFFDKSLAS